MTINRQNLTSIENGKMYSNCVFFLDDRMQVIQNCHFSNCSFRSRRVYFWKITNCVFKNCSFHKIVISIIESSHFENEYIHILDLSSKKLQDDDLEFLQNLKNVNIMYLFETNIKNHQLQFLEHLTKLQQLYLYNTAIDSKGLKYIKHLELKVLDISRTKVDDSALDDLLEIKSLERLYIYGSFVHKIKKQLSHLTIIDNAESFLNLCKTWQER